jgi:hypothetical protein
MTYCCSKASGRTSHSSAENFDFSAENDAVMKRITQVTAKVHGSASDQSNGTSEYGLKQTPLATCGL